MTAADLNEQRREAEAALLAAIRDLANGTPAAHWSKIRDLAEAAALIAGTVTPPPATVGRIR